MSKESKQGKRSSLPTVKGKNIIGAVSHEKIERNGD